MCLLGSLHAPGWPQNSHCHCPLTGTVLSPCLVPQLSPRSALAPSSSWHRHCPHPWHRHCLVARDHRHSPQLDTAIVPHVTSQLPPSWPWHRPHPWHHHCPHWWHCHCPQLGITVLHVVPSLSPVWHRHCPLSWHRHCPPLIGTVTTLTRCCSRPVPVPRSPADPAARGLLLGPPAVMIPSQLWLMQLKGGGGWRGSDWDPHPSTPHSRTPHSQTPLPGTPHPGSLHPRNSHLPCPCAPGSATAGTWKNHQRSQSGHREALAQPIRVQGIIFVWSQPIRTKGMPFFFIPADQSAGRAPPLLQSQPIREQEIPSWSLSQSNSGNLFFFFWSQLIRA